MATFDHIPMGESGLRELYDWLDNFISENESIAYKQDLSKSSDTFEVPAIFITNNKIPDNNKQIALITLGRHGQELGTRVVGPEIMQYLASDDASIIRDTQLIIIVPVLNPEGFIKNDFNSSMTSITKHERIILGTLFSSFIPDMILDIHSLGKIEGSKYDHGDMEVIIPANTTRWAMDEQIHQYVAQKMQKEAESKGWPYEIHTLEDLALYYFGETEIGNLPWRYLDEKVFLLQMLNSQDNYEFPTESSYTNYTCAPAYLNWHSLVFGMETNHWSLKKSFDIAASGMIPSVALLKLGSTKFPWEKDIGYPVNILHGDFRVSLRPIGKNATERRLSRIKLWNERKNFSIPCRELQDENTTLAQVRYFGENLPLEFALCMRMRQKAINHVYIDNKSVSFEYFKDDCSTYIYIPIIMNEPGTIKITIEHPSF
jgi:Zinc carboxypeptidase